MGENLFFLKKEDLVCAICLECWVGRDPRILRCQHTFCFECLEKLASAGLNFVCPLCQEICPLLNGEVNRLKKNLLNNTMQSYDSIKQNFDKNDGKKVIYFFI